MARIHHPTAEQEADWAKWVASRPPSVRAVAERFDPWSLYLMKSTGQRVMVRSFQERHADGRVTLTVDVTGEHNLVMFERQVFGIEPDDLEPCDPPPADEPTGAVLTEKADIEAHIEAVRPFVVRH